MANLTTLINFNDANGSFPTAGLIADANGDLFGTTRTGGDNGDGTVFEITKIPGGYASTLTTLVSFNLTDGATPTASLIVDANGDLFGTASGGGSSNYGTVFEIAKTAAGYASTPITFASFDVANGALPNAGLFADANGDLFGTASYGGDNNDGTVFEIAKTAGGYASTLTTLVSFNDADGAYPSAQLIVDANGDLFGTTVQGGAILNGGDTGDGTVFEIAKTAGGYASTPTTLVTFDSADGDEPFVGLLADANGDLFGTTSRGGASGYGTVFEIAKTAGGYASTPTTLANFNGADGNYTYGALIADAAGDLFGTAYEGGASDDGTVFEIAKTATGYASAPTVVVNFNVANGSVPEAGLIADAGGDLFGTTSGLNSGGMQFGTVFELTDTGYVTPPPVSVTGHSGSVTLGSGASTVTVAGYHDSVTGTGMGAVTLALTGLSNTVTLGDGNDTVTTNGKADGSTIMLGNGNDGLTLGTNNNGASLGDGADMIALGGFNNTVTAGNGNDTVTGGTGHAHVTLGNGNDTVTLGGWDNSVALGDGINQVDAGAGSSTVQVTGGQLTLAVHGFGDMVFLHGDTNASISDLSKGLSLFIDSDAVVASISGFGAATGAVVHLQGLGFTSVSQVLGDLHDDGAGGTFVDLGTTGYVDFASLAPSSLHAANFALS